jgi:hypothetical protein
MIKLFLSQKDQINKEKIFLSPWFHPQIYFLVNEKKHQN